jgi:hypothetical protein
MVPGVLGLGVLLGLSSDDVVHAYVVKGLSELALEFLYCDVQAVWGGIRCDRVCQWAVAFWVVGQSELITVCPVGCVV